MQALKLWRWDMSQAIACLVVVSGLAATTVVVVADRRINLDRRKQFAQENVYRVKASLEEVFYKRFNLTLAVEAFVHSQDDFFQGDTDQQQIAGDRFQKFGEALDEEVSGIYSLQLARDGVVTYVTNAENNKAAIGHDLFIDDARREQILRTIQARSIIIAGPIQLLQGGEGIIARKAIFTEPGAYDRQAYVDNKNIAAETPWLQDIPDDFWGFATAVIQTETFYEEAGLNALPDEYHYGIRGRHGLGHEGEVFWGDATVFENLLLTVPVTLPDGEWIIGVQAATGLPWVRSGLISVVGVGASIILGLCILINRERQQAIALSDAKSTFLATMSHELRTPLNGMIGMNSLLLETELNKQQQFFAETIQDSSENLLAIINKILDFSKVDAAQFQVESISFDLPQTIAGVVSLVADQAKSKGLQLHTQIDSDISRWVAGDKQKIEQVLLNLLNNSIKFTSEGQVTLHVSLALGAEITELLFEVVDTGIGINPTDQAKLFQPFSQVDSSITRRYGGTGLGLVICEQLCKLMGGRIGLSSEWGKGTKISVWLPYQPVAEPSAVAIASTPTIAVKNRGDVESVGEQMTLLPSGTVSKVLLVEDLLTNQKVMKFMLKKLGFETEVAANGLEAIAALEKYAYKLVLMDWHMPEMDGITATKEIRRQTELPQPWIIAVTADAQAQQRQVCLDAGMNDYLTKPVTLDALTEALGRSPLTMTFS